MTNADFILSIISSLIGNGITSFVGGLMTPTEMTRRQKVQDATWIVRQRDLQAALQKGSAAVARKLDGADPQVTDRLRQYLISPEAEAVVRHLLNYEYAHGVVSRNRLEAIREEFSRGAEHFVRERVDRVLIDTLFEAVVTGARLGLIGAAGYGLVTDAMRDSAHQSVVERELTSIEASLRVLRAPMAPLADVLAFEEQYRRQMAAAHATIFPPNLDRATPVPLADLFIEPAVSGRRGSNRCEVPLDDLIPTINRTVVLGNPGGGKSTLAQYVCYLLSSSADRLVACRNLTPVLIVLRDYGSERKLRHISIATYIEELIMSRYQLRSPDGAVEYLLSIGRLLVVFDGLDELLETSYRREVTAAVESFCTLYPSCPVFVTSREVGYEQAPLDPRIFTTLTLAAFDDERVRGYALKWFALDSALTPDEQVRKAETFLEESKGVADLRTNPLMLGLLCNIYRGENYIPQNRPDVYEKCAVMLFERWDTGRGIRIELPFRSRIRPALTVLAHWIYSHDDLQRGVRERQLVMKTTEYLLSRRFEDRDEAEMAAMKFIEFCRGRAWVFTDTGSMPDGEAMYQFTHRTFMEFFTAEWIVRSVETTEQLYQALRSFIARREWDVVAQLAFQLRNRASDEAADLLLTQLIEDGTGDDEPWNCRNFALRSLDFLVPSPRVTRKIVATVLNDLFERVLHHGRLHADEKRSTFEIFSRMSAENRDVAFDEIANLLRVRGTSSDPSEATLAAWILLGWERAVESPRPSEKVLQAIREITARLIDELAPELRRVAQRNASIVAPLTLRAVVAPSQIVQWERLGDLYRESTNPFFENVRYLSYAAAASRYDGASEADAVITETLADLGATFLVNTPKLTRQEVIQAAGQLSLLHVSRERIPSDALFGLFCLYAPAAEEIDDKLNRSVDDAQTAALLRLLRARKNDSSPSADISADFERLAFNNDQREFVNKWRRSRVSLLR